ncbi:hypothetical protein HU200_046008 [Digitaria exilis]|uniref:SKP1 component POZ domain-containing protein n=1 Tax=Digitaria exilis TaxID=1010633 RepID=A0A835EE74_9POAL|nr:hypothetical protein HU200_046008 [Digitaria exilis]
MRQTRAMEVEKGKGVAEAARKEVADGDATLKSSNGKPFEVSKKAAARLSTLLALMIKGCSDDGGIKPEKICSETLEKVVDYCNKHAKSIPSAALSSSSSNFNTAPSKKPEEAARRHLPAAASSRDD